MRFTRGAVRDHIVSSKIDHGPPWWRGKATQQQRSPKIDFREIFRVVRFSTFATISAMNRHAARSGHQINTDEVFGTQASAAKAAGCSRTRNEQRLHVCAACHSGIRRLEVLAQFSLLDERARNNKGVLQAFSLPECDIEKGVAEIGPLGLVPAAERRMVGIGRRDYQRIGVRETRNKDPGIAGRDDHHLISHACPRQHVGEIRRRERLRKPPRLDCKAGAGAVRGENQKQNVVVGVHPIGRRLQGHGQAFNRCTSAFLRIVLHIDRAAPETARYDLCCTGRLASKHALIAEKAEGHYAHLASILNGVHRRNRRRDRQNESDERRAEPADPRLGGHGEPRLCELSMSLPVYFCGPPAAQHSISVTRYLKPAGGTLWCASSTKGLALSHWSAITRSMRSSTTVAVL